MSLASVRAALESKLNGITPSVATAWENNRYTPVSGTPYQAAFLLPGEPDNATMGTDHYREVGIFQVSLFYPLLAGPASAASRAELIRSTFKRGSSMVSGSTTVRVNKTPAIGQGRADGDRWMVPVKIQYFADVHL